MKLMLAGSFLASCLALSPLVSSTAYGLQVPATATVEQDLQIAREERDRELAEASKVTDAQAFERRKAEIFARYAEISAAIRRQAEASGNVLPPPPTPPPPVKTTTAATTTTATRQKKATNPQKFYNTGRVGKTHGRTVDVADLQSKLDDENARHERRLAELNRQLRAAESAGKKNEVRKLQSAIAKENAGYAAKKADLEKRITDAGGTVGKSPAPAPARKTKSRR